MNSKLTTLLDQLTDRIEAAEAKLKRIPGAYYRCSVCLGYDNNDIYWKLTFFDGQILYGERDKELWEHIPLKHAPITKRINIAYNIERLFIVANDNESLVIENTEEAIKNLDEILSNNPS